MVAERRRYEYCAIYMQSMVGGQWLSLQKNGAQIVRHEYFYSFISENKNVIIIKNKEMSKI